MYELTASLGGRIVDAAVAAAAVSGLVALAMIVTRQPSRRRALARAGIVGTLLVVPLVWLRPYAPVDLFEPVRLALEPWRDSETSGWPRWAALRAAPAVLLAIYLAGVVFGVLRLALGGFGSRWIGRNSRPASDAAGAVFQALPFPPNRRRPALRVSDRTTRPVLLGTVRPTILIPPGLDEPAAAEPLRLALLHELAHAESSDPWFGLAAELASVLWFWLPPLRWIGRQMRLDQEFLADRCASSRLGPSGVRYASALVEIAAARDAPGATAGPAAGSALLHRVLMLVRCPFVVEGRPPGWWRVLLGLATALLLLLATGLTLRARALVPPPPRSVHSQVEIPQIVLDARGPGALATTLPLRLPKDFDLDFDLISTDEGLARIEVLGHLIAAEDSSASPFSEPRPHHVTFRRRDSLLRLRLDEGPFRTLPGASSDETLSVRGVPDHATILRAIRLAW